VTGRFANAVAAQNSPGYTVLYKDTAMKDLQAAGLLNSTGAAPNLGRLLSRLPSDFSKGREDFTFTPSHAVAEKYRRLLHQRREMTKTVVICFRIPNAAVKSLVDPTIQRIHRPSPEWKQLIWHYRREHALPPHLVKYKNATLIIGTIATRTAMFYSNNLQSWE
jgi:hypothetical protein